MQIDATRILIRRRLSTILAADVAGYSRLMGANEERTLERLDDARAVMDAAIARYGGRIANTAGDSVIAEFPGPAEAVRCALEVQEEIRADYGGLPEAERLQFRIGINLGSIMANGRDVLGDNVNIAARIENIAQPGGICISDAVYDRIKSEYGAAFRLLGPQSLKNISRKVVVYEAVTPDTGRRAVPAPRPRRRLALLAVIAAVGAVVAALAILVVTGVVRLSPPAQPNPTPESMLPSPLPEPAAGPSTAAAPPPVETTAPPATAQPPVTQPTAATEPATATSAATSEPQAPASASPPSVATSAATTPAATPSAIDLANLSAAAIGAIQGFDCAKLQADRTGTSDFTLSGYVGSTADAEAAVARLAAVPGAGHVHDQILVLQPPLCTTLSVLDQEAGQGSTTLLTPLIDEGGSNGYYYEGDSLGIGVTPTANGYLYVDLVDGQTQEVTHLLPSDARPDNRAKANQLITIGTLAPERKLYKVGPPFGLKLLVVMQSSGRLFDAKRKSREPADTYLADLRQRLRVLSAAGGQNSPVFSHTLLVYRHR